MSQGIFDGLTDNELAEALRAVLPHFNYAIESAMETRKVAIIPDKKVEAQELLCELLCCASANEVGIKVLDNVEHVCSLESYGLRYTGEGKYIDQQKQ